MKDEIKQAVDASRTFKEQLARLKIEMQERSDVLNKLKQENKSVEDKLKLCKEVFIETLSTKLKYEDIITQALNSESRSSINLTR